ncbi:MAG: radical SAM protein [Methanothrix sp.]|jgi:pyruvate formate-lyase activating enzyme-like uncharacterized protein|uniref:radical SAM protein n=1 Tax=Methanothrix sp. TaxID=90426 RepID=UPI002C2504E6|nr:radical SAM protein [Methanothrix sp.]
MPWQSDSVGSIFNYLSPGCQICRQGAGLVLFVTGRCERSCFYCPISEERRGRDVVYADEQPVHELADIMREGRAIGALGTGITGGEPLLRLDYVLDCIRALKKEFGDEHHIHLYTGLLPSRPLLEKLAEAGLDEIRFHPPDEEWSDPAGLKRALQQARELGLEAGVEIPAYMPAPALVQAVRETDAFLNLNELEFSESNLARLRDEGFSPQDLGCAAVGSEELARDCFLKEEIRVHYCPSRFKDAVQLRERLRRRAERTSRPLDHITSEGTIIHGIIEGEEADLMAALEIIEGLQVPYDMYCSLNGRIEIAAWILEEICADLMGSRCTLSIIERYPLKNGLVVERIPL